MTSFRFKLTQLYHRLAPRRAHLQALAGVTYPEPELALLPRLVDPLREAIDVGANFGVYMSALAPLSRHVHAIEAHPRLAGLLRAGAAANVTVHQRAVSDRDGESVELAVAVVGGREIDGLSRLTTVGREDDDAIYPAQTISLDSFSGRSIGFVKIDIEGHELAALNGAERLIEKQRPVFLVEAEQRHRTTAPLDVFEFFDRHGYKGFFSRGGALRPSNEFTIDLQDEAVLAANTQSVGIDYINNFIFVPPDHILAASQE